MSDAPRPGDFEKLGFFYLGRRHDLASGRTLDEPVLYESRDLVTHGVCIGMTGSGKTGLCLGLIEEAAIDGIPVIAIDPKGDIGNLLLTFPGLSAGEFRPWVNQDDARRAGVTVEAFAAQQAETWTNGLTAWGQDAARIERLRKAAEFTIFTPGSRSGRPVSILSSLAAPAEADRRDAELLTERAAGTATGILVLAGVEAPPRSREHTLLASLLTHAWQDGVDVDLASLIRSVQAPPFEKIGVVDVESFYSKKDRFELAMRLNGMLAAPGFETWLEGEPLDPQALLYTATGQPRVSIFSIAHLGDAERMFFVSLLMNQMVSWMRRQSGTASLRAIFYMDEILGYFPPVASPPSKAPLLTMLKQGRAFGLGVLLATQNPVDLDYKALGNIGTWFLGRLQTERDKARLLDGLEGLAGGLDRAELDRVLSALKKRIFLMHNVHASAPVVFETRWTLSYLRGPLSREDIKALTPGTPASTALAAPAAPAAPAATTRASDRPQPTVAPRSDPPERGSLSSDRPVVPPGVQEFFLPPAAGTPGGPAHYRPAIIGAARVNFSDKALRIGTSADLLYVAPVSDDAIELDWADATRADVKPADLRREPAAGATFAPLPAVAAQARKYAAWEKSFARWLTQNERVELLRETTLGLTSNAGESERDFRVRLQHEMRSARDEAVEAIRKKYASKQAVLRERLRRTETAVQKEEQQVADQKLQTAVSFGATVLGSLFGRKAITTGTLGRATTAARGVGRMMKESSDVKRAAESVESVKAAVAALEQEIAEDVAAAGARFEEPRLETIAVAPKRGQVEVQFVALGWVPDRGGSGVPAAR
jgi:hypothetical protein